MESPTISFSLGVRGGRTKATNTSEQSQRGGKRKSTRGKRSDSGREGERAAKIGVRIARVVLVLVARHGVCSPLLFSLGFAAPRFHAMARGITVVLVIVVVVVVVGTKQKQKQRQRKREREREPPILSLGRAKYVQVCTKRSSPARSLALTKRPPCATRPSTLKHAAHRELTVRETHIQRKRERERDAWREPAPGPTGPRSVGTVRPASFPRYAPAAVAGCVHGLRGSLVRLFPFPFAPVPFWPTPLPP